MPCISITSGKTSETPARASGLNQPTKLASPVLTVAWASITATFGAARRNSVGAIGASTRLGRLLPKTAGWMRIRR
jgi:hypothetical protein